MTSIGAIAPQDIYDKLGAVAVDPGASALTPTQVTALASAGIGGVANSLNGYQVTLPLQSLTGPNNADMRGVFGNYTSNFNTLSNDPVVWWGLNRQGSGQNAGTDPWGWSEFVEGKYETAVNLTSSFGTATGGSSTTLVHTGRTWTPNCWANMVC